MQIILIFIFLLGLIVGSFLNCLIWRLHKKESLGGRSYCPKCRKKIIWYDNIPLLSFIILKGECRHCKKKISLQYPIVELTTGLLFVIAFLCDLKLIFNSELNYNYLIFNNLFDIQNLKFVIQLFRDWFLICVMTVIFIYDLRWYLILDIISLPACLIVFLFNLSIGFSWQNLLVAGIIGCGFFLIQFLISNGKWIGGGDIRLGLLMGLALGWPNVLVGIFIGYFVGSIVGIYLIVSGKKSWGSKVPLGIFLSVATIIVLFYGDVIVRWYLNLVYIL